ncbi:RNA polymerase sigma-70 factor [Plebeiibacterium sediminum]|uniref:RNA polymerase sigma factor n=1 Tax=Plebeiibacterium sediminum TaxID=2992112 RepID=A0AAE3SH66_9BACT|nr:RNA polymerase sigma-70 factor [Plebeiobacterium sediminum]MCW3789240.1 RNA polymerase sigma-70 factor [Plebeiobacterium sediminum]
MEKQTLILLSKGNEEAFSSIYCEFKPALINFVKSLIKLEDIAEDITQQVFLSVWLNRKDINTDQSFSSYLFTIAKNTTLNYIRKDNNNKKYLKDKIWDEMMFGKCYTEESIEHDELLKTINDAINSLTNQKKKIFEMSRRFGKTHEEIATELNISKNTVKNHMVDSISQIKRFIESKNNNSKSTIILLLWLFS